MDGLLGLAPDQYSKRKDDASPVSLFIDELEEDGVISQRIFSVFLADTRTQSKVHFGGWDERIVTAYVRQGNTRRNLFGLFGPPSWLTKE